MGLMLNERCNADEIAKKMTFRDACAAHESDGIKALRLASWEATVLPLLRRAMAERPELRDARVKLEREGKDATFEVKLHGGDWDRTANIRRSRFADIAADCAALAEAAAAEASKLRAKVCLECVAWNGSPRSGEPCGTCGSIDAAARAAMLDAIEREIEREIEGEAASVSEADFVVPLTADDWNRVIGRTMRDGQAADAVTIEYESAPYAGFSRGKVELSVEKQRKGPTGTVRLGALPSNPALPKNAPGCPRNERDARKYAPKTMPCPSKRSIFIAAHMGLSMLAAGLAMSGWPIASAVLLGAVFVAGTATLPRDP